MHNNRIHRRALLGGLLATPALAQPAWPTRPIRLICPYAPGGAADTATRLIQPGLSAALGVSVVVENRSGGASTIGAVAAARAAPDGYTFLVDGAAHAVAPLLVPDLPIDYPTAFVPIGQMTTQAFIWMVTERFPAQSLAEFVAVVRERRQSQAWASASPGSTGHLVGEAFRRAAGLPLEHIAYRGGSDVARDIAAGVLEVACSTTASAIPLAEAGRARLLATSTARRALALPEVPTFSESGFPQIAMGSWLALFAPTGLPLEIVQRLNAILVQLVGTQVVRERLLAAGFEPEAGTPDAFARLLAHEREVLGRLVREIGLAHS